jgi:XTP/dITP diphosphohydrolase
MTTLLIATQNAGKQREFLSLLHGLDFDLLTPDRLGLELEVEESGATYAENARLKGLAFARLSGLLTLADDSGLEVDALNGQPGIRSSRYAPEPKATDADRRTYLLENLRNRQPPWSAHFCCVVVLVLPPSLTKQGAAMTVPDQVTQDGYALWFAQGACPGEIIPIARGDNGFGYDPIFYIPHLGHTMAELEHAEKNTLSHRARAVQEAHPLLQQFAKL